MEQRSWNRESMALDVEIRMWRPGGEEVLRCKTLDVSLGGAELLTYDITFPKHRVLEIRFTGLDHLPLRQPRILGKFVRKTANGMVVQFRQAHNETIKSLLKLIIREQQARSRSNTSLDYQHAG